MGNDCWAYLFAQVLNEHVLAIKFITNVPNKFQISFFISN